MQYYSILSFIVWVGRIVYVELGSLWRIARRIIEPRDSKSLMKENIC